MKMKWRSLLCLLLTVALLPLPMAKAAQTTTTVLLYVCGSDLETDGGAAVTDLKEIIKGMSATDKVRVLVETGGAEEWQGLNIKDGALQRHELTADGLNTLATLKKASMADASTFADFLRWGMETAPADRTVLLMWNHGGGPVYGFGADELFNYDTLTLSEMEKGLKDGLSGQQLAMIGFDACLMGSLEVASVFAPYADYMLASEELEPGDGWDYTSWISALCGDPAMDIPTLGKLVIDSGVSYYSNRRNKDSFSLALLDLSKIAQVEEELNSFGLALCDTLDTQLSSVSRTRAQMGSFGEYINEDASDMVDILALCDAMSPYADTSALRTATQSMIVASGTTTDLTAYAQGVSILVPYSTIRQDAQEMLSCYNLLDSLTGYGEFVRSMVSTMSGSSYTFTASAPTNLATCTVDGIWGELVGDSDWSSDYQLEDAPQQGLWGGYYDTWYDCWYDDEGCYEGDSGTGASLWAGLNGSTAQQPYNLTGGQAASLWGGLNAGGDTSSTTASDTPSTGLWAGLSGGTETSAAPSTGLWAGLDGGTTPSASAPDLAGLWGGLEQSGGDYYAAGEENPNVTDASASADLNAEVAGYFSASSLELQAIYALQLTKDELDHLQSAEAVLLNAEGTAEIGALGKTTIDWQTGSIYAMFDGSWPMLAGNMVTLKPLSDSSERAVIPARVGGIDMYLLVSLTAQGGEILGATEGYLASSGLAARGLIPLTVGLEITLLHPSLTENAASRWVDGGTFTIPSNGLTLTYQPVPAGSYAYAIRLTNIYAAAQLSQTVPLTF